jgi:hypothetical protein
VFLGTLGTLAKHFVLVFNRYVCTHRNDFPHSSLGPLTHQDSFLLARQASSILRNSEKYAWLPANFPNRTSQEPVLDLLG